MKKTRRIEFNRKYQMLKKKKKRTKKKKTRRIEFNRNIKRTKKNKTRIFNRIKLNTHQQLETINNSNCQKRKSFIFSIHPMKECQIANTKKKIKLFLF